MSLVIIILAFFAIIGFLAWRMVLQPGGRLERLAESLAAGKTPRSLFIDGPSWFTRVARHLETISARQERNRQKISELEFNLDAILGSMVEGVAVVDSSHVIRLANTELCNLFGLTHSPLRKTVLEALRDANVEILVRHCLSSGRQDAREITLHESAARSEARQVHVNAIAIRTGKNESKPVSGAVLVFNDISQIRKLEEVRREFVANVSHELRTPLSIFRGYLETLIDSPNLAPEDEKRILETMWRHSDRLNSLVEDLLTLTRLESRRVELDPEKLNVRAFLQDLLLDYKQKPGDGDTEITLALEDNLPDLEADPVRLEQVIFNLLDNAVRYTRSPRRIEISAFQKDEQHMAFEVRDNGIGIPANDLPHIFARFYRVDKARSREQGGTGLGLSIVKHIVQQHGGSVSAQSQVGKGTTILLSFPLVCRGSESSPNHAFPAHPMSIARETQRIEVAP